MDMKHAYHIIKWMVLLLCLMSISGCLLNSQKNDAGLVVPEGGSTQPSLLPEYAPPRSSEGSLWMSKSGSMYEDSKAAHIGDTVIVDIIENATSKMDVNTETSRETSFDIGLPQINLLGHKEIFGYPAEATKLLQTDSTNSMGGEGTSDRSGQITASIAARVTEVLPNGNLSLFGRRAMKVNNEVQYITVSGIVRPQDVSASNRVKSTYLADSRIEYYGKGVLADKQKPGWGTRLMDTIWPW
ncbi:MAG: flagellar basal body L-ring protein FlgH [Desulfobacteraceae bacterium]|nr:flagellar basal body L-ring protein FlgH [Desulfobacteraceae bacterium]